MSDLTPEERAAAVKGFPEVSRAANDALALGDSFVELHETGIVGELVDAAAKAAREHNVTVMLTISPNDG